MERFLYLHSYVSIFEFIINLMLKLWKWFKFYFQTVILQIRPEQESKNASTSLPVIIHSDIVRAKLFLLDRNI